MRIAEPRVSKTRMACILDSLSAVYPYLCRVQTCLQNTHAHSHGVRACDRARAHTHTHTHTLTHTHTQGIAIGDELVAGDPTGLSKPEIKKLRIANTQAAFDAMMEGYKAIGGYDQ